jgi:hypothetical protein
MARHRAAEAEGERLEASDIVITTPGLTEEEIAAVTAVIAAVIAEQAGNENPAEQVVESAWMRGRRSLRGPLPSGPGAWRSFGGRP